MVQSVSFADKNYNYKDQTWSNTQSQNINQITNENKYFNYNNNKTDSVKFDKRLESTENNSTEKLEKRYEEIQSEEGIVGKTF